LDPVKVRDTAIPSTTAMEICGRDERMLAARVEQKNEMTKDDKKWRDAPLTKKAPYKPGNSRSYRDTARN